MTAGGQVRVAALSAHGPTAPSFRVRVLIPRAELARRGVEVVPFPLLTEDEDRAFHGGGVIERGRIVIGSRRRLARAVAEAPADTALIHRQADMLPVLGVEASASKGRRLVLDVDDAVWVDSRREAGGHPLAFMKGTRRKLRWLAERADAVIAGNRVLADWLGQYSERVTVIPSLVEHRSSPVREHADTDVLHLGWIGSATTAPYLEALSEPLAAAARALGDRRLRLTVMGGPTQAIRGVDSRAELWTEEGERQLLARMDVGLMPLPDNEWTRGKCSYKALQYMAAGIPVVADNVGVSAEVVGHEQSGLVAKAPGDWTEAVTALARDAGLRARLGARGRRRVKEGFSVERWAPELAGILRGG